MRILHLFADDGVEAEPMSAYGDVYRVGIDPIDSMFTHELAAVDLMEDAPPWEPGFDLVVAHPDCREYTNSPAAGEEQIGRARSLCREWGKEYIIENQPYAPLREPAGGALVTLTGDMFGLPVEYRRAFECSFPVEQPAGTGRRPRHRVENTRPKAYWKSVKGVTGDYRSQPLITAGTPAAYIHYLVRPLLPGFEYELGAEQAKLADGGFTCGDVGRSSGGGES